MKAPRILANVSNILVTVFLIVLIPSTIIGTYFIVINSNEIQKNTKFRERMERENDSLNIQLKLEKRINTMHRDKLKEEIE